MKRKKNMLLLLGCLALLLALTLGVSLLNAQEAEDDGVVDSTFTVFSLDPETVTDLCWSYSEDLVFEKSGDGWSYAADSRFPLDESFIQTILSTLSEITATRTIENVEDWDDYGLQVPVCHISVTAGETGYELKIGLESGLGGSRYLSIGDGNAYLVSASVLSPFCYGLYDLVAEEEIPDMRSYTGLSVERQARSYAIEYDADSDRAYSSNYVWFLGDTTLDTELTESFIGSAADITWKTCANYYAEDLAEYGLEEPEATVTIFYDVVETTEDGEELRTAETFVLDIGSETEGDRYACLRGSRMVYTVSGSLVTSLLETTAQELLPDEVFTLNWNNVHQLDIFYGGETYELIQTTHTVTNEDGEEEEQTEFLLDGEPVSAKSIFYVINTLNSDGYASGATSDQEEVIRFVIHRDQERFSEVELVFYPYDSSRYLTVLDGKSTVFAVREDVDTLVSDLIANVFSA